MSQDAKVYHGAQELIGTFVTVKNTAEAEGNDARVSLLDHLIGIVNSSGKLTDAELLDRLRDDLDSVTEDNPLYAEALFAHGLLDESSLYMAKLIASDPDDVTHYATVLMCRYWAVHLDAVKHKNKSTAKVMAHAVLMVNALSNSQTREQVREGMKEKLDTLRADRKLSNIDVDNAIKMIE